LSGAGGARTARAWAAAALLFAGLALIGWFVPHEAIDWQPARFAAEPWRAFSAIGVHYGGWHLAANLAGAAAVGALGVAARTPRAAAIAWLAAWPLTHIGLLIEPALVHYGGLSGVLHAGVAAVALFLVCRPRRARERPVGVLVLVGVLAKIVLEAPWGAPLRPAAVWGITTAPLAHATGLVAGLACAALALRFQRTDSSNAAHV
jgi:rhomboid family GlyGly-CTERM serine protease